MKVAYVQTIGGASGDMLLASMIDAGLNKSILEEVVESLSISGVKIETSSSQRGGTAGTHVDIELDKEAQLPRTWQDFTSIVSASDLSESIKSTSYKIFQLIGQAEAAVHETELEHVQLHELGTLDTVVDVVGVVAGLEFMGIEKLFCSALPTGSGTVRSQHGLLPVPAPATSKILSITEAPSYPPSIDTPATGEMLTPTGAAILGTIAEFQSPTMRIERAGFGMGTRNPDSYPNLLTFTIGELIDKGRSSGLLLLETNIDDTTGEILGYVQERLFEIGVKDVWFTPIQMKKNRPAILLSTLVSTSQKDAVTRFLFAETSTLGIRVRSVDRVEAERKIEKFRSSLGEVNVKLKTLDGEVLAISPEYEDCKRIALEKSIPLVKVFATIQSESLHLVN